MSDNKTTNSHVDESTFDFSPDQDLDALLASFSIPESTEAPAPAKQVRKHNQNASSTTVVEPAQQKKRNSHENHRENYRHPVRWRVAIVNKSGDKHDIYHGRTYDLSLSEVSILIEHNVSFTSEVVILLAIPPMHLGEKETIVEIQCSTTYTLLDSVHGQFRIGAQFIHFKGDGKRILSDILSKRHIPNQTAGPYI